MQHVFKSGGSWKDQDGFEYTIKAVSNKSKQEYLDDGWYNSLADAKAIQHEPTVKTLGVDGGERERFLRDEIARMGGKAGGRCSMETLESKYAELKAETEAE